jgi:hypothetical protein
MNALEILLGEAVDYAGLFPPAALGMAEAARNFAEYRGGAERWMLGRFVAPAARLGELSEAVDTLGPAVPNGAAGPWRVSALAGAPPDAWASDLAHIAALRATGRAAVDALELRGATTHALTLARGAAESAGVAPAATFVEVPWDADHAALADAARELGVALKLRTGGVTPDAFPDADVVLRFLAACVARGVRFKLTAGLHHALRGEHPLTYEPECPRGTMHGFLNVLAATALLAAGHAASAVAPLLAERDAASLSFDDDGLRWRGLDAGLTDVRESRRVFASFGSCSFAEPVTELRALGLLTAIRHDEATRAGRGSQHEPASTRFG